MAKRPTPRPRARAPLPRAVQFGDHVALKLTGRLESGEVFDTTDGAKPFAFRLGSGLVFPAFEQALLGMTVGECRAIRLAPHQAYGARDEARRQAVERSRVAPDVPLEAGQVVSVQLENGQSVTGTVESVEEDSVRVDLNHPLAGRDLIYDVELTALRAGRAR